MFLYDPRVHDTTRHAAAAAMEGGKRLLPSETALEGMVTPEGVPMSGAGRSKTLLNALWASGGPLHGKKRIDYPLARVYSDGRTYDLRKFTRGKTELEENFMLTLIRLLGWPDVSPQEAKVDALWTALSFAAECDESQHFDPTSFFNTRPGKEDYQRLRDNAVNRFHAVRHGRYVLRVMACTQDDSGVWKPIGLPELRRRTLQGALHVLELRRSALAQGQLGGRVVVWPEDGQGTRDFFNAESIAADADRSAALFTAHHRALLEGAAMATERAMSEEKRALEAQAGREELLRVFSAAKRVKRDDDGDDPDVLPPTALAGISRMTISPRLVRITFRLDVLDLALDPQHERDPELRFWLTQDVSRTFIVKNVAALGAIPAVLDLSFAVEYGDQDDDTAIPLQERIAHAQLNVDVYSRVTNRIGESARNQSGSAHIPLYELIGASAPLTLLLSVRSWGDPNARGANTDSAVVNEKGLMVLGAVQVRDANGAALPPVSPAEIAVHAAVRERKEEICSHYTGSCVTLFRRLDYSYQAIRLINA
jgi:hypothetical protein